jgi:predicted AAA+ superfamily ATPase
MGADHKTVQSYLHMLQDTGLTHNLSLDRGGNAGLRTPDKVLLENANLYNAIAVESGFAPDPGSLRETFFVSALKGTGVPVQFSKEGDYRAAGKVFEIGGPGKTRKQLRGERHGIVVKDGPLMAAPGEIPLHLFGFLW